MSANGTPLLAPPGCAWVLAQLVTPACDWRPYYRTRPEYGFFEYRHEAEELAARVRQGAILHAILLELPKKAVEEDA
jgi:hypothetical protein